MRWMGSEQYLSMTRMGCLIRLVHVFLNTLQVAPYVREATGMLREGFLKWDYLVSTLACNITRTSMYDNQATSIELHFAGGE